MRHLMYSLVYDVKFGEREIDYLANREDNYSKQRWVSTRLAPHLFPLFGFEELC